MVPVERRKIVRFLLFLLAVTKLMNKVKYNNYILESTPVCKSNRFTTDASLLFSPNP